MNPETFDAPFGWPEFEPASERRDYRFFAVLGWIALTVLLIGFSIGGVLIWAGP